MLVKGGSGYNNSGGNTKIEGGTTSIWTYSASPTKVDIYGGDIDNNYTSSGLITVEGGKQLSSNGPDRSGGHVLLMPGTGEGTGVSGNVGVGTTSPASKLEVAGVVHSTSGGFKFPDNSVQTSAVTVDGHSLDASDGSPTDSVYVDADGKVGIGTASPEKTLHLVGDAKLTGTSGSGATALELSVAKSTSGKGGKISIRAGEAQSAWSANHWGGDILVKGGSGYNNSGGDTRIEGGTSSVWTKSSAPTRVDIYGGDLDLNYSVSGLITVEGGKQLSSNAGPDKSGGHILLMPGTGEGAGVSGNVGVGTTSPASKLEVAGVVHSTSGGFKFPDNSVQTSAVTVDGHSLNASDGSPTDSVYVDADGKVGVGTTTPTAQLDIAGSTGYDQLRVRTAYTPTGTADTNGNTGDITWDDSYIYVKTSAGWKRAALSAW